MHPLGKLTPDRKLRIFLLHGYHHEFPQDPNRLVAPVALVLPFLFILTLIAYSVFGGEIWYIYMGGLFLGYLAYDWMHYYTHHFHPKREFGKFMVKHHAIHHYVNPTMNYGLSSPIWDYVFGTATTMEKERPS